MKFFNLYKRTPLFLLDEDFTIRADDIQSVTAIESHSLGDYVVVIRHGNSIANKRFDTLDEAQSYVAEVTELMICAYK